MLGVIGMYTMTLTPGSDRSENGANNGLAREAREALTRGRL